MWCILRKLAALVLNPQLRNQYLQTYVSKNSISICTQIMPHFVFPWVHCIYPLHCKLCIYFALKKKVKDMQLIPWILTGFENDNAITLHKRYLKSTMHSNTMLSNSDFLSCIFFFLGCWLPWSALRIAVQAYRREEESQFYRSPKRRRERFDQVFISIPIPCVYLYRVRNGDEKKIRNLFCCL